MRFPQVNYDIYRSCLTPIVGPPTTTYGWPNTCITPSTVKLYPMLMTGLRIVYARWLIAWDPQADDIPTGVHLVAATDGPNIFEVVGEIQRVNTRRPLDDAVDITVALQKIWPNYSYFNLGNQMMGNGVNGAWLYESIIEVAYEA